MCPCLQGFHGTNQHRTPGQRGAIQPRATIHQGGRASIITDLPCCDKEADRSSAGVCDRVQFGIHAALGQPDQASSPPFFNRRLEAVRCALRYVASMEMVLSSGASSASPIMIRANTPISLPLTGNTCVACVRGGASSDYITSSAAHTRQARHTTVTHCD